MRSQSRGCTGEGTEPVSFPFLSSSSVALTRGGIKNLKLQLGAVWDRAAGAGSEVYIPRRPPSILVCLSPNVDFGGGARIEESLKMKVRQKVLFMRDKYCIHIYWGDRRCDSKLQRKVNPAVVSDLLPKRYQDVQRE